MDHGKSKVLIENSGAIANIALNDPAKRNALGLEMFDALDEIIARVANDPSIHIVLLSGQGSAFCAGFDLAAAVNEPTLMGTFIQRLSLLNRALRRMPQVVVAAVQGAAIAGGCALLSACDFVFVSPDAKLGYPVHRIGVSPAVTIPTLSQAVGAGAARSLLMSGELIDGYQAKQLGLATHVSTTSDDAVQAARAHCVSLSAKGFQALRITKHWLNELDGSLDDEQFSAPALASSQQTNSTEAAQMLQAWNTKTK